MQIIQIKGLQKKQALQSKDSHIWRGKKLWWRINQSSVQNPSMILASDTSGIAMGATWETLSQGGYWSWLEKSYHINVKELLATFLALQSFAKFKRNIKILIKRQCNSRSLHKQNGENKIKFAKSTSKTNWCQIQ